MKAKSKIYNFVFEQHWTLGLIESPLSDVLTGKPLKIHYVRKMPKDRWFADPFILDYDDHFIYILVEEFSYNIRRGRLAKLTIDRHDYCLLEYKIILDLSTHLSFPFIERVDDKILICPENSESGSWEQYEYDRERELLIKADTLVKEPLTDAIVTDAFGEKLIFATHLPTQNGNTLSVYSCKGELLQEVRLPSCIARNAGAWFNLDGNVYRPAQDCNGGYGKAVIIQRVNMDDDGSFIFEDVCRIESDHPKFTTGCHTLNSYKGYAVIDVHGYRKRKLAKIAIALRGRK